MNASNFSHVSNLHLIVICYLLHQILPEWFQINIIIFIISVCTGSHPSVCSSIAHVFILFNICMFIPSNMCVFSEHCSTLCLTSVCVQIFPCSSPWQPPWQWPMGTIWPLRAKLFVKQNFNFNWGLQLYRMMIFVW